MPANNEKYKFKLVSKKKETDDVITLRFNQSDKKSFSFIPGQYVIAYLHGQLGPEGKAYTISSIPSDKFIEITVKKIGRFSTALHELKIGSVITLEGPKGFFYPEKDDGGLVFLAAGIGITPFLCIMRNYAKNNILKGKKIYLFYSNKYKTEVAFFDELNKFGEDYKDTKVIHHLTRQVVKDKHIKEFARIDINSLKKKLTDLNEKDYFICGPIRFVLDIRRALINEGVSSSKIHTESFY